MGIGHKVARLFLLYAAAAIGSIVSGVCCWILVVFTLLRLPHTAYEVIGFLALPIGSALGMYLLDKWLYKTPRYLVWRILAAYLMSIGGFILLVMNATQTQKNVLLSPLPFEAFLLHPIIIGFFSLIGYMFVGLFTTKTTESQTSSDEEDSLPEEDKESSMAPRKRWWRFIVAVLFLSVLAMLGVIAASIPPAAEIEVSAVEDFFQQFLTSIISDTDFYKAHSSKSAIENIQANRSMFSGSHDRYRNRCQRGLYEYSIIFNEKHQFKVKIEGTNRHFVVSDFRYGGITKVRSWSDPPMTEEATNFFGQTISSINSGTDFYKKHSTESAIKEIQTYQPMISSNNVLVYRHWEGEYDYYFYVEFDGKHGFEVHVEASKKGCFVKNFTYLGERGKWKIRWLEGVSH